MKKVGLVVKTSAGYDFNTVVPWITRFFGLDIARLPFQPIPGEEEGSEIQRLIRQYERSRINRAACIEIHGSACKICGLNFEKILRPLRVWVHTYPYTLIRFRK